MMLLGVVWAAFAPLLLLPALAAALRLVLPRAWPAGRRWAVALGAVLVAVALAWGLARHEFNGVCVQQAAARMVAARPAGIPVDGILLESDTANSFGMRYLNDEGFAWMEAPDHRRRGGFVRYRREADGHMVDAPIDAPTARYAVRETFHAPHPHTHLMLTEVIDRQDGRVIARAGSAQFDGGIARWVLGAWGTGLCPSATTDPGGFQVWYHLARNVLRGA